VHHDVQTLFVALGLSLAAVGCSSSHETLDATNGVYDLTVASEVDACSPLRTTGPMGTSAVVAQGPLLTLSVPDLTSSAPMLVALNENAGYTSTQSEMLAPCTGATLERAYTIVGQSASGFDVAYRETWTGMSTCGAAMRAVMPAAPSADCRADLVLHFQLHAACESPCELRVSAAGDAACHC
jgi:hypothetical protein